MVRLVVVGAGVMGANHARVASTLRDATLVAVVDADESRAQAAGKVAEAQSFASVSALLDSGCEFDGAIVAVPTGFHVESALPLIAAGKHVLVEKPIAPTTRDAQILIDAAEAAQVHLLVGHIERFNPAVLGLDQYLDQPLHVECTRMGPFAARVADGVVLDLMIHDIDIVRSIARSEVVGIQAIGRSVKTDREDLATALLTFASGLTATLTASRLGQTKIRQLEITQDASYINIDLIRQDLTISRVEHSEFLSDAGRRYRQTGVVEIPFLEHRGEPLAIELSHFVDCILGHAMPRISGADGLAALRIAQEITALTRR